MAKMSLKDAEKARDSITKSQAVEIRELYRKVAKDLQKEMTRLKGIKNTSSALQQIRIKQLQDSLNEAMKGIGNDIDGVIRKNILDMSQFVCNAAKGSAKELGFKGIIAGYASVPDDVVRKLVSGQIYNNGWSLSERVWDMTKTTQHDIYQVVAAGVAQNKGAYEIAKDLEDYVNPDKRKQWNLKMSDGKRIYKKQVDYCAQRLARTLVQHSYQQSVLEVTKNNPWCKHYVWHANGSRVCPLCKARDGQIYSYNDLPLDHPNGMCVIEPSFESDNKIINDIADWINSDEGAFPEIDKYAEELTGISVNMLKLSNKAAKKETSKEFTIDEIVKRYGNSKYKVYVSWLNKLPDDVKDAVIKLKEESGLSWAAFYDKNIVSSEVKGKVKEKVVDKVSTLSSKEINKYFKDALASQVDKFDDGIYELWTNKWLENISEEEKEAVTKYTSEYYETMNKYLRTGTLRASSRTIEHAKKVIESCSNALNKAMLPEDTIVRRGSDYNMLSELGIDFSKQNKENVIGAIVTDKGFTSTSPYPSGGFSMDIEYLIKVPKNSHAMYVAPISEYENEKELLINKGAMYRVDEIEYDSKGINPKKIYMTLVNLQ